MLPLLSFALLMPMATMICMKLSKFTPSRLHWFVRGVQGLPGSPGNPARLKTVSLKPSTLMKAIPSSARSRCSGIVGAKPICLVLLSPISRTLTGMMIWRLEMKRMIQVSSYVYVEKVKMRMCITINNNIGHNKTLRNYKSR